MTLDKSNGQKHIHCPRLIPKIPIELVQRESNVHIIGKRGWTSGSRKMHGLVVQPRDERYRLNSSSTVISPHPVSHQYQFLPTPMRCAVCATMHILSDLSTSFFFCIICHPLYLTTKKKPHRQIAL